MTKHKTFISVRAVALVLGATLFAGGQAAADQVIADDLIVQGSACVGLDCVNNESFGIMAQTPRPGIFREYVGSGGNCRF